MPAAAVRHPNAMAPRPAAALQHPGRYQRAGRGPEQRALSAKRDLWSLGAGAGSRGRRSRWPDVCGWLALLCLERRNGGAVVVTSVRRRSQECSDGGHIGWRTTPCG